MPKTSLVGFSPLDLRAVMDWRTEASASANAFGATRLSASNEKASLPKVSSNCAFVTRPFWAFSVKPLSLASIEGQMREALYWPSS
jgi:hypothetical protein